MSEVKSEIRDSKSEIVHVTIEAVAWVTQLMGGDGTRRQVFQEPIAPGATVRSVLRQLSDRFPKLQPVLWDRLGHELNEYIEVLVNDAVLGLTHTLDSQVRDGDRITLLGAFMGG